MVGTQSETIVPDGRSTQHHRRYVTDIFNKLEVEEVFFAFVWFSGDLYSFQKLKRVRIFPWIMTVIKEQLKELLNKNPVEYRTYSILNLPTFFVFLNWNSPERVDNHLQWVLQDDEIYHLKAPGHALKAVDGCGFITRVVGCCHGAHGYHRYGRHWLSSSTRASSTLTVICQFWDWTTLGWPGCLAWLFQFFLWFSISLDNGYGHRSGFSKWLPFHLGLQGVASCREHRHNLIWTRKFSSCLFIGSNGSFTLKMPKNEFDGSLVTQKCF